MESEVNPYREFRDELPALLRDFFDWTGHGIANLRHAVPVMCWLLTSGALLMLLPVAAAGHGLASVYRRVAPESAVVPFGVRKRA